MDNLESIKYKDAGNGWYWKIDVHTGDKISFKNGKGSGSGLFKEMQSWIDSGNEIEPQFTKEELKTIEEEKAAYELVKYKDQRRAEYPEIGEQLDYIYWNGLEAWKNDMITPVKKKFPKPS